MRASGKSRPRGQTSVCKSSVTRKLHGGRRFIALHVVEAEALAPALLSPLARTKSTIGGGDMQQSRLLEAQERGAAARANAVRFAELASIEDDEAMKTYLRHVAVSWAQSAERYEFLIEIEALRAP